jgi:hypothetical protein
MHLNVFVCTLFAGSKPVKIQTRPNRTGTDPAKNQTGIGLVSRWQKPDRTEPFRGVIRSSEILIIKDFDRQRFFRTFDSFSDFQLNDISVNVLR